MTIVMLSKTESIKDTRRLGCGIKGKGKQLVLGIKDEHEEMVSDITDGEELVLGIKNWENELMFGIKDRGSRDWAVSRIFDDSFVPYKSYCHQM